MFSKKILTLTLLFFSSFAIFDAFSESPSLKEIDELINKKDYNKALSVASEYMKLYPNDFDRAQKRIDIIIKKRKTYDNKAELLVDTMKNDNENDEQKMALILELEGIETNQSEPAIELTRQARKTLALKFYIARYNRIMAEGYSLLKEEKYAQASAKFQEGFYLKPNDTDRIFDGTNVDGIPVVYDEDITIPVDKSLEQISNYVLNIEELIKKCELAYMSFQNSLKAQDNLSTESALSRVKETFKELADLRNKITGEIRVLKGIDKIANDRNPLLAGFSYITFTLGFIEGDENEIDTGVVGTIDYFWNTRVENMKNELYSLIDHRFANVLTTLPLNDIRNKNDLIPQQIFNIQKAASFSKFGGDIQRLYTLIEKEDGSRFGANFNEYEKSMNFIGKFANSLEKGLLNSKDLSDKTLKKYADDIEDGNFTASETYLKNHLTTALRYEDIFNGIINEDYIQKEKERENKYIEDRTNNKIVLERSAGTQITDSVLDFRNVIAYEQKLTEMNSTESSENVQKLWNGIATMFANATSETFDEYDFLFKQAQTILNGIEVKSSKFEDENGNEEIIIKKYPREALKSSEKIINDVTKKNADFKNWRKEIAKGEHHKKTLKIYADGVDKMDEYIKKLDDLVLKSRNIVDIASKRVKLSELALTEAKENYDRALSFVKKEDFSNARKRLELSRQKYIESLNIQESAMLRAESDKLITELGERIVREENAIVIREVRNMKDDAQDLYYDGKFELAEKKLVQAQTRWAVTNTEPDIEIENLLDIVKTARTMQSGRKLSPSDPLYSDMSQLLSIANLYYEQGEKLMKKKDSRSKDDAKQILNSAMEKIKALQQIYLRNEDAAFLSLKIEKLIDPIAFEENFGDKIRQAKEQKTTQAKLAALQDLYNINPKYPGLEKLIYDLKVETGIIRKPVTDTSKKDSEKLYKDALAIFNKAGSNQAMLKEATSLLDKAISLYPRNRDVTRLKDRIQSKIGGTVVAVLTADDEQLYQRAVNYYTAGNYIMADTVLKSLWKNPAAQKTAKIIDLRNRVNNRL